MLLEGLKLLFSEILRLWLNRNKFCHYLTKPIITRIILSLMFKNVIIRIEVTVFRDFITLVKYVQILSLFNEAIITRIIVSLVLENVVVRAAVSAVLFSEIL